jgi:hypothetical protein
MGELHNFGSVAMARRPIQFKLKHLFVLATAAAVICALAKMFGIVAILVTISLTGPVATILTLARTGKETFSALGVGVTVSTFAFGIAGLGIEAMVFLVPTPGLIFSEHSMLFWMTAPLGFAYLGFLIGLVGSFHAILLWQGGVRARQWLASRPTNPSAPPSICRDEAGPA